MQRSFCSSLLFLAVCALGIPTPAQPASSPQTQAAQSDGAAHITLGQSALPLYGPWKFTIGDPPVDPVSHTPLWAEPGFDDSQWENVDLTPEAGAVDPTFDTAGYVPGWTAKGHPGYWGYAWYRIRVRLQALPGERLALAGPADMDDAYEVFSNGIPVGHFGDFGGKTPLIYSSQPMMFQMQQPGGNGAGETSGSSTQILAFRVFMAPSTLKQDPDVGGLKTAPVLGEAEAVAAGYQMRWLELVRSYALGAVFALLFGLLTVLAFSLVLFDRSDRVYLWMGVVFLLTSASYGIGSFAAWTQQVSIFSSLLIRSCLLTSLIYAGWVMVWWVWFGRQRPAWMPRAAAGLALLYMVSNAIGSEIFFALVPHGVAASFNSISLVARLLFLALLAWIVVQGILREGLDGWLVMPAVLLWGIVTFAPELRLLHIRLYWAAFGLQITLGQIANLLLVLVISLLLLRRLLISLRLQRRMALDVRQAQEVQQVILPEARTTLPGLAIESEYRPAREVGGDFFQIIPHKTDGTLLIVAGDVTGKGLKAGMLVALLVGAIRSTAELNSEPKFVLEALNRRLMGRGDAQATCLALRIATDGAATLANAGHMPPYLNGEPLPMQGALPLGMIEGAEVSVMRFKLNEGDRLVLMSDGVVEATNADGKLFGFERVHALLQTAGTAAQVAQSAQQFGQEDDISVIAVTRTAVLKSAMAS